MYIYIYVCVCVYICTYAYIHIFFHIIYEIMRSSYIFTIYIYICIIFIMYIICEDKWRMMRQMTDLQSKH